MEKKIGVSPSILAADFADISSAVSLIEDAGGDYIHCDVMDGQFVPNITFGPKMVADIHCKTTLPLDVHLMINEPDHLIPQFCEAGAYFLTIHSEACRHLHRSVQLIRSCGVKPGISIVPSTPITHLSEILPDIDQVLVMTVNPGFGGQSLIPRCIDKIKILDDIRQKEGYNYIISVDGGINRDTVSLVKNAGVDLVVSGSAFFGAEDPSAELLYYKTC